MKLVFSHLSNESVVELALGDAPDDLANRARQHLAECAPCHARLQSVRALRTRFAAAPTTRVNADSLARVLERRAAGERLILADVDTTTAAPRLSRTRIAIGVALAASVGLAVFGVWRSRRADNSPLQVAVIAASPPVVRNAQPEPLWPSLAYAADAPDVGDAVYGPAQLTRVQDIRAGTFRYVRSSAVLNGDYHPTSVMSVDVSATTFERQLAWRVVTTYPLAERPITFDTAWLRRADLTLLYRRFHRLNDKLTDAEVMTQRARADTLLVQTDSVFMRDARGDSSVARDREHTVVLNPRYLLVTDQAAFLLTLRALPLHATWKGRIDINSRSPSAWFDDAPRHVNLRVDGDSLVHTFWGDVPCWRVMLENGREPEQWLVGKRDGETVLVIHPATADRARSRLNLVGRGVPISSGR